MAEKRVKPEGEKKKRAPGAGEKDGGEITAAVRRLTLSTVPKARATWTRLMREYDRRQLSSERFRDWNSAFRTLLAFLTAEREQDLVARMTAFEQELSAIKSELQAERGDLAVVK